MGDHWMAPTAEGTRRIDSTDFVRVEVETALARQIPVVPVLVGNAKMPTESELPVSLQSLVNRNAAEVRPGRDLQHHLEVLLRGIETVLGATSTDRAGQERDRQPIGSR